MAKTKENNATKGKNELVTIKPKKKPVRKTKKKKGRRLSSKAGLTKLQVRFCEEFIIDWNASAAAARAGYSKASAGAIGFENLKKPEIQERVGELSAGISKKAGLTAEWVIGKLVEIVERSMEKVEVTTAFGVPVTREVKIDGVNVKAYIWKNDASNANRALELLGKYLKLFTDKVEHSGAIGGGKVIVLPSNGRDDLPKKEPNKKKKHEKNKK
jgi:phage terminase small subunit